MSRQLEAAVQETLLPESLSLWLMEPRDSQPAGAIEAAEPGGRPA